MANAIDGNDLSTLGWKLVRHRGVDAGVSAVVPTASLPDLGVDIESSLVTRYAPRSMAVTWGKKVADFAALNTALASLKALVTGRAVVLTFSRRPSQQITARCTDFPVVNGIGPQEIGPFYLEAELGFTAVDPFFQDVTPQAINVTTSATALPQGTADTDPVLLIVASGGSVVNPTWTYKNSAGTTLATLAATITILNGDALEIDCQRETIRKRVSGVWSNAASVLPLGFLWPVFSPRDGVYLTSTWPTAQIAATSGSANAVATATYPRKWS